MTLWVSLRAFVTTEDCVIAFFTILKRFFASSMSILPHTRCQSSRRRLNSTT